MQGNDIKLFRWESEVRGYELDLQGIVNNANYLHYFDHVRIMHSLSKGIDWQKYHADGFNLVLVKVDMEIKFPLKANDRFYVTSRIERVGKIRILFHQAIYRVEDDKLIAKAVNTVVCLAIKNNKPTMPEQLEKQLFLSESV